MPGTGQHDDFAGPDKAEQVEKPDPRLGILRAALWVVVVVAGLFVFMILSDGIEVQAYSGNQAQRWIAFAEVAAFVLAVVSLVALSRHGLSRDRVLALLVPVALVLALVGLGIYTSRDNNDDLIWDYCSYGSESATQLARCIDEVTPGQVIYSDTAAANFANGVEDECGIEAGPYCADAAKRREVEDEIAGEENSFR